MLRPTSIPAAALFATLVVAWLVMLVVGGPGSAQDLTILEAAAIPLLVPAAHLLTIAGGVAVLLPVSLAAALLLALRGDGRSALLLVVLVLAGRLAVEVQKMGFDRLRPDPAGHLVAVHSMAFPSGHAANSMIAGLGIALLAVHPRFRLAAIALALAFSFLVGLSRLVLSVHWPSDVIGGWAFGAAWTLALLRLAGQPVR